jgi:hypothetical protein
VLLNERQREKCLKLLENYQDEEQRSKPGGMTFDEWYEKRLEVGSDIDGLVKDYLSGDIELQDFRREIDSMNKTHNLWGFNAWKGQFYFNMIMKFSGRFEIDVDMLFKNAISEPRDDQEAISKMHTFYDEVEKVASTFDDRRKGPNPRSTPYLLTYFWQIQNPDKWPIQYPSSEQAYNMLSLWSKTGNEIEDAQRFLEVTREIHSLYDEASQGSAPLRLVGFVIYDYFLKQQESISEGEPASAVTATGESPESKGDSAQIGLPKSYIPPIVSVLPQLARMEPGIQEVCEAEGQTLPQVFEQRVATTFRLLGFEIEVLGQGRGRVADVIAKSMQHHYALILDAKARTDEYTIGTESRKFIEYIRNEVPRLKREGMDKVYFGVVSGRFPERRDPAIREIKLHTGVHGVVMFRADDLLLILDRRFRQPEEFDLGSSGFMGLLMEDGVVSKESINECFGL